VQLSPRPGPSASPAADPGPSPAASPGPGPVAGLPEACRPAGSRRQLWGGRALRLAGSLAALAVLAIAFRHAHVARIRALLGAAPWLLATPVFYFLVLCCDALGWRRLVMNEGRPISWWRLLKTRTAAEALGLSLPSGGVLAEGVSVYLLRRICGVPPGLAVASLAARRFFIFLSFGVALTASAMVGHALLTRISHRILGHAGLGWVVPVAAAVVLLAAFGLRAALLGGTLAGRMFRILHKAPIAAVRRWLEHRADSFSEVDRQVEVALTGSRGGPALTTLGYLGMWVAEAAETFFIFSLLGAGLSFRTVFSFDGLLTLIRGLAFFTPSGLGVQDLGYLAFLKGLGVPHAVDVGAAFVLVKRCKEIFWIIIGYLLLARHAWDPRQGEGGGRRQGQVGNA
jgi:glycosyltransferase 2 family protein